MKEKSGVFLVYILCAGLIMALTGCFKEDFSSSSADRLSFSTDSIRFDTIFTQQGTATKIFKVYNRNDKALLISSIVIANAANTGFFINVDGSKGPDIYNIEVSAHDSIFVFVEAKVNPSNQNKPLLIKDSIIFITNGVRDDIKLQAYGQDAVLLKDVEITDGTVRYTSDKPYIVYDTLAVREGATLVLEPGARLFFHDKAKLVVEGKIIAAGGEKNPVVLRGDRTDNMFSYLPYDRLPGQWKGVYIRKMSYDNVFDYVHMRGTVDGLVLDSSDVSREKIKISNSILHNSKNNLLTVNQSRLSVWNSEISNGSGALIWMTGGVANLLQCTLANYFSLFDNIHSQLLVFDRFDDKTLITPPQIVLDNCIIIGSTSIMSPANIDGLPILFRSCMFGVAGSDDANFINSVWKGNPMFNLVGGKEYIYDYRIGTSESSVFHAGDESLLTNSARRDMYGTERPYGQRPDIGAYQIPLPKQ
ncbi:MAG: hypothetical protein RR293_00890 [Bacteroidales bacterium]